MYRAFEEVYYSLVIQKYREIEEDEAGLSYLFFSELEEERRI